MAEIKLTNELLKSEGQNLLVYANNLNEKLEAIDRKINDISDDWKGLSQQAYLDMYYSLKSKMDQLPSLVEELGNDAITAADSFGNTDESLANAFESMDG